MPAERPYHHGDLRVALLACAVDVIGELGAASTSVREVARRAGVSHAAAAYHFGDKAGLLAAVAADGYERLAAALAAAREQRQGFLEMGVAYVRFALAHPAHFEVMYHPALYDRDAPDVAAAKRRTAELLYGSTAATPEQVELGVAGWSIVHGFVTLWLNGNLPPTLGDDPEAAARTIASHLHVPRRRR
jgi:AcrR family transcriptional regulator